MMKKNYNKPQWTCVILDEEDIVTLSIGQISDLSEGENEIGNWWDSILS
jgi:hypothetical protein